ncbi:MAG: ABC transporter substrate-binding protein [Acidobacteriota bacterium]
MEKRSVRRLSAVAGAALALLLVGCPSATIQLGAVLPLTGDAANYGEAVKRGVELAYEEILADPDFATPIALEIVDSGSDPRAAADLLEERYGAGDVAVLGGVTSGEAKAMMGVVDRYERVLLSPSASSPELTGISRNFYRIWPSDHTAANKMAQSAAQALSIESIVIIAEEQPYAKDIQEVFSNAFAGYEGEVLDKIEFPPGTSDLAALVEHAVSLDPHAVYLAGYADGVGAMIQELRRLGYKGEILTTSAFATPAAIAKVGDAASGVFLTQTVFETDSDHAHIQKFVNAYQAKYGEPPDIYAAHGYDAMRVLAEAVRGKPAIASEIKKGLRDAVKEFPGVTGSIQFDDKGDVRKFPRLYKIDDDLLLVDYNERMRERQEEIRQRKEALRRQLEELQKQAAEVAG